jgi:hypothetical protein
MTPNKPACHAAHRSEEGPVERRDVGHAVPADGEADGYDGGRERYALDVEEPAEVDGGGVEDA